MRARRSSAKPVLEHVYDVLDAVRRGQFGARVERKAPGITGRIGRALNDVIELNEALVAELKRMSDVVGREGRIGQRASIANASGGWREAVDCVNTLIANLVQPTVKMARVIEAVANGDLSQTMPLQIDDRALTGEYLRTANTVNTMVAQLNAFASEVTRVAREVGTEGKLGGQAEVRGVSGVWKDLTDNVNLMASNLTSQVRNIADVTTAVANGDLSKKITVDVKGEILHLKNTINIMVDQLGGFASEVTRVAREVGTEGILGGQAQVRGVAGIWKDLTDSVNFMASNLTSQVRNIAAVTTAVAKGDLSKKITVDARGEILQLKDTVNTMVDQLNAFASEVTRVALEVGTEGKLGGQAQVKGVSGTWKDLTDSVNLMANNLTSQVRNIAEVTTAVARGDLSKKITVDVRGEILDLKNTINTMVDQLNAFASEVTRVAREVGTEGQLGGQAQVRGVSGTWKDLTDNVNFMAGNLTSQVRNIAAVTTAVANGDLSKKITVDVKGEILELKDTINTMVDQLNSFASEVTRVAREVGTDGKLGGQAMVRGVGGTWKDLTDNVNSMAANLTNQVRGIARVVTAVAKGDLKQKLVLEAKGEIAELADTINAMIDTLATFAEQVTSVAREVGIEGKLGGQANVPGAAGTWRDLTDNVNRLAANLTTQVRAIAEVATAVTKGDLSRSVAVEALGEVAALKDNINEMIRNLRETTRINTEQDWLKTNLAKFTRLLQGQGDLLTVAKLVLSELAPLVEAQHGVFYFNESQGAAEADLKLLASYAHRHRKQLNARLREGEGLVGQVAFEKEPIVLTDVPDDYVKISSALGAASPRSIVVLPVLFENQVKAVIELASFKQFNEAHLAFLDQLTESIGIVLNTIGAKMRTEELLKQSQSLTQELQHQQQELQETNKRLEKQAQSLRESERLLKEQQETLTRTNEELEEKASLLSQQNSEVERKNSEIELARQELEEKAEQLALSSKYKSEFLANMSHELRTPLNSLLILSKLMSQNPDGNLTPQQVEHAATIHAAGSDLLALINEILDLAKIESGMMEVDVRAVSFDALKHYVDRNFQAIAQQKGLAFDVELAPDLPASMTTDPQRLQQVLRNLLSNAFKFTDEGSVSLRMAKVERSDGGEPAIAFSVSDTGIGVPPEKHKVIFEAFQQADGTTSREYGGTGLGLSISREIATLLGGEITVQSAPGQGSSFTLYLPLAYAGGVAREQHAGDVHADDGASRKSSGVRAAAAARASVAAASRTALRVARERPRGSHSTGHPPGERMTPKGESPGGIPSRGASGDGGAQARKIGDGGNGGGKVPGAAVRARQLARGERETAAPPPPPIPRAAPADDRAKIKSGDRVLLVIDDDPAFAEILMDVARGRGFRCVLAQEGETGLSLARELVPDAITLDINMPGMNGWAVLDRLKHDPAVRHVPVHVVSASDDSHCALRQGARLYMPKPSVRETIDEFFAELAAFLDRKQRRLLVVEDDERQQSSILELVGGDDVRVTAVKDGRQALEAMREERFDCIVLDLGLPDMSGFDVLARIREEPALRGIPVLVYTARDLTRVERERLRAAAEVVIVKDARSPERLLEETVLFLHRAESAMPPEKRKLLEEARRTDPALNGAHVLVVDDDVRNVFALTAALEQRFRMRVLYADNGEAGIAKLAEGQHVDVVLMDVMMPGMDGYETMRRMRELPRHGDTPIIALTAKAMKGDREKCIEAGASDYIAKPVDIDQLASLIRVWVGERRCDPES